MLMVTTSNSFPGVHGISRITCPSAVENQVAQHRAGVINQVENHRPALVKIFRSATGYPFSAMNVRFEIDLAAQVLVDCRPLQAAGQNAGGQRRGCGPRRPRRLQTRQRRHGSANIARHRPFASSVHTLPLSSIPSSISARPLTLPTGACAGVAGAPAAGAAAPEPPRSRRRRLASFASATILGRIKQLALRRFLREQIP
jgi:hypothetical protein